MLQFLMHLSRPDGVIPLLGDDDGGRALALCKRTYRSFNDALCVGAILFLREDFKHQAGGFFEDALWLLGEEAWDLYQLLDSAPPAETHAFYPSAGYAIQRSGWGPLDSHLVFDFGGLGMSTGGHAHADALSVALFSQGRELLADPGTFVYNCAPEWRNYFRSTRAHNTVTVDGRDQAEAGGTFLWKTRMSCTGRTLAHARGSVLCIEAEHDGYARPPMGVTHRRRLLYIPQEYWILVDDFRGSGRHDFDFNFHFGSGIDMSTLENLEENLAWCAEGPGLLLAMFASAPMKVQPVRGSVAPIDGWVSQGYGQKTPGQLMRVTLAATPPVAAMTFLSPLAERPVARRIDVGAEGAIACSYRHGAFEDIAVLSNGEAEIAFEDLRMQGEFFWLRREGDVIRSAVAIGARSFQREGRDILEDVVCAESAAS
jgi:hypothetical protein